MIFGPDYDVYQVLKDYVALPAAGAFDTPREVRVTEFSLLTLFVTYKDGGGAGGAVTINVEHSPHTNDANAPANTAVWYKQVFQNEPTITPGTTVTVVTQDKELSYTAIGTAVEGIALLIDVKSSQRIRVSVAESGDTANPGDCALILLANAN